jgi:hypothetical protein
MTKVQIAGVGKGLIQLYCVHCVDTAYSITPKIVDTREDSRYTKDTPKMGYTAEDTTCPHPVHLYLDVRIAQPPKVQDNTTYAGDTIEAPSVHDSSLCLLMLLAVTHLAVAPDCTEKATAQSHDILAGR